MTSEPGYIILGPLMQLIGFYNEATVVVDGVQTMAIVDTGSQVSTLMEGFCLESGLTILPLEGLCLKEMGVFQFHNKGYTDANLIIPDLSQYNEYLLFMVVSDHKYGEWVPEQLGTLVIDNLVVTMTTEELQQPGET